MRGARCWVSSGAGGGGAIACVELAGDVDGALAALGVKGVDVGGVRRRSVPVGGWTKDDAVVARWTADRATVMTHGGRAVVDGFLTACASVGVRLDAAEQTLYVEATDEIEEQMLAAIAKAQSPAALELLLDQPQRWRERSVNPIIPLPPSTHSPRDIALRRLIDPALVVAVGPPNIGKSSLLNALAGRGVSVVADQPGTTRDHVGALIDLAGVVVRWVDTPGLAVSGSEDTQIQHEAQRLAREVAAQADVLVVCCDAGHALAAAPETVGRVVRVGLRSDLGRVDGVEASVTVRGEEGARGSGTGLERLVEVVREAVVPRRWMEDGEPWHFW